MSSCSQVHDKWYQSRSDPSEWPEAIIEDFHWKMLQTVVVTAWDVVCPITENILHQVFDSFGLVEEISILPVKENNFQALLRFQSTLSVSSSIQSLNGRNICNQGCKLGVKGLSKEFFDELGAQNPLGEGIEGDVFKSLKEMAMAVDKVLKWVQESESRRMNPKKEVTTNSASKLFDEMPVEEFIVCDTKPYESIVCQVTDRMLEKKTVERNDFERVFVRSYKTKTEVRLDLIGVQSESLPRLAEDKPLNNLAGSKCGYMVDALMVELKNTHYSMGNIPSLYAFKRDILVIIVYDPGGYTVIMSHSVRKSVIMDLYVFKIAALNLDYSVETNVIEYDDLGCGVCAGIDGKYSFETLVSLINFFENELKSRKNDEQHMVVCSPTYAAKFGIESKGHMEAKQIEEAAFEVANHNFAKEPDGDRSSAVQLYAKEASRLMVDVIKRGPTAQVEEKPEILSKVKVADGAVFDISGEIVTSKLVKKSLMLEEFQCSSTRVESERGIAIAEALGTCNHLKKINLRDNIFGVEAGLILSKVISLFSDLTEIYLSYLSLEDEGYIALVNALKKSAPTLEVLDMCGQGGDFDWQGTGSWSLPVMLDDASWLSNEEPENSCTEFSLPFEATNLASQWLELLSRDIGGRLEVLIRSKSRVPSVITTELSLLVSRESKLEKENVDARIVRWSNLFQQMALPVNKYAQEALLVSYLGSKCNRQPSGFFCYTLIASDTSTLVAFPSLVEQIKLCILEDKDLLKRRGMSEPEIFKKDFIVLLLKVWTYFIIILELRVYFAIYLVNLVYLAYKQISCRLLN